MRSVLVFFLLPIITRWIEAQERHILATGTPLDEHSLDDAHRIGVAHPERVRLLRVAPVPLPCGPWLARFGSWFGVPAGNTAGLTAHYGIFIHSNYWGDRRLIAHELAHTAQYERLGGARPFLRQYLTECLANGYASAPLELEAIAAAADIPR